MANRIFANPKDFEPITQLNITDEFPIYQESAWKHATIQQILDVVGITVIPPGTSGGLTIESKSAAFTAASKTIYLCDTSAAGFSVTFPPSPVLGDYFEIWDAANTFAAQPVTTNRNGHTIQSIADDISLNVNGARIAFAYTGSTWQLDAGGLVTGSGNGDLSKVVGEANNAAEEAALFAAGYIFVVRLDLAESVPSNPLPYSTIKLLGLAINTNELPSSSIHLLGLI